MSNYKCTIEIVRITAIVLGGDIRGQEEEEEVPL